VSDPFDPSVVAPNTYCCVDDVAGFLPPGITVSGTTDPSDVQVASYILDVADELNGALRSKGFSLPVTSDDIFAISYLNSANVFGALGVFYKVKYPSDAGPGGSKGAGEYWEGKYQHYLKGIESGALGLPDEDRSGTVGGFEHSSRPFARRRSVW